MIELQNPRFHSALALILLALALLLTAGAWLLRAWWQARNGQTVDEALSRRHEPRKAARQPVHEEDRKTRPFGQALEAMVRLGTQWAASGAGMLLMAEEDRHLLDRAGYRDPARARALFLVARVAAALALPAIIALSGPARASAGFLAHPAVLALLGFGLGWMLPKWLVSRRAKRRIAAAARELPLLIDLLRLLQGVGLSVDQSLHIIVDEFHEVMPVLAEELHWSLDMHARGRPREQSLSRLSGLYGNDDLAAICRLLCQVDHHGGAVQEPLARFSERLRDQRKLDLKAQVGKLSVKMTSVMVVTLLPALLIITGGSGFIAVLRGLTQATQ